MTDLQKAMLEDVREAETLAELSKLEELIPEYPDVDIPAVRGSIEERREALSNFDHKKELVRLMGELQELKGESRPTPAPRVMLPNIRKYKLVKTDCSWTQKPQVHVLMEVMKSVVSVGEVVEEQALLDAVEANKHLLNTRQDSARVFNYYKSAGGFIEHGNLEKVY